MTGLATYVAPLVHPLTKFVIERRFAGAHTGITQGWTGSLDSLYRYLTKNQENKNEQVACGKLYGFGGWVFGCP